MVGLLDCKRTLTAHVELLIHQYPQVLLLRAGLKPLSTQPALVLGIASSPTIYLCGCLEQKLGFVVSSNLEISKMVINSRLIDCIFFLFVTQL